VPPHRRVGLLLLLAAVVVVARRWADRDDAQGVEADDAEGQV
jgi:hypothetical protein